MSDDPRMPPFPEIAGQHEPLSDDDRNRILAAAWAQSYGSAIACQQLCREHVLGEINLFAEDATAMRVSGTSPAPGDRRLTATGGETGGPTAGPPVQAAARPAAAPPVSFGAAPPVSPGSAGTVASSGTVASGGATVAGTAGSGTEPV